jgi:hypothetical protein
MTIRFPDECEGIPLVSASRLALLDAPERLVTEEIDGLPMLRGDERAPRLDRSVPKQRAVRGLREDTTRRTVHVLHEVVDFPSGRLRKEQCR